MRVAIINSVCGYGSTGRNVIKNYNRLIKYGHMARIFYGLKRQKYDNSDFVFIGSSKFINVIRQKIDILLGTSGLFCFFPTYKLFRQLNAFSPDIVWLNNIHGGYLNEYLLLRYLKQKNIFTVYGMPDEYAFLGKCCSVTTCEKYKVGKGCYKCPMLHSYPKSLIFDNSRLKFLLKKRAYDGFDNIVFRSAPYVIDHARQSILLKNKELIASDSSVDIENIFFPRNTYELRTDLRINEKSKIMLLCAPFTDVNKGGKYFLEAARKCYDKCGMDIVFINVAFDGDIQSCPPNFIGLPYETNRDKLALYYSLADAYVCTSISDAQPNSCLEALGCGTPIIGFNCSGVPYIAPNEFGTFVTPFKVDELVSAIIYCKKKTKDSIMRCHEYANNRFSNQASEIRYQQFIDSLVRRIFSN